MESCHVRIAGGEDAEKLLAIYAPYVENTAITFEYEVPSIEEFRERIEHTLSRYPYLVAERGGEIMGYVYASAFKTRAAYAWAVETSIYIRTDAKHLGLGKLLYTALEGALKLQNITNVTACIVWMEKHIGEHAAEPAPFRSFDDIRPELKEKYGIE